MEFRKNQNLGWKNEKKESEINCKRNLYEQQTQASYELKYATIIIYLTLLLSNQ